MRMLSYEEYVKLFKGVIENEHRLPKRDEVVNNIKLGNWLTSQVTNFKKGTLSEERIKMLNDVNPYWNKDKSQRDLENQRLLISSDWKSHIPNDNTPIDKLYQGGILYFYLSHGIYDIETLISSKYATPYNIFKCYGVLLPFIDEGYARLLVSAFGYNESLYDLKTMIIFFESFAFLDSLDMARKMELMLCMIPIKDKQMLSSRFLSDESYVYPLNTKSMNTYELVALHKLKRVCVNNLFKTNCILDYLPITNQVRSNLYRMGLDTEEKILEYFDNHDPLPKR